jgi:hypothetical protein
MLSDVYETVSCSLTLSTRLDTQLQWCVGYGGACPTATASQMWWRYEVKYGDCLSGGRLLLWW